MALFKGSVKNKSFLEKIQASACLEKKVDLLTSVFRANEWLNGIKQAKQTVNRLWAH